MRYVMFMIPAVYSRESVEVMPSVEAVEKMMAYNAELADAGVLEALDGLHPPGEAVRLVFSESGPQPTQTTSGGSVGGYWILDVDSHEAAVEWASRVPAAPGDVIELRRIQAMDDFPDDLQEVVNKYDL